ncbi:MAG: EAL domain-containing protein [Bacilli bacterium]|nr:EAL domain-containing protein [Bacilli bacterium]
MGDVGVIALCAVVFILIGTSYVVRNKSYRIFCSIIGLILISAIINIGFNEILVLHIENNHYIAGLLYLLRVLYHMMLFNVFFSYALYIVVITNMEHRRARTIAIIATILFIGFASADIGLTISGIGFNIDIPTGIASEQFDIFMIGYGVFVLFLGILMFRVRKLVYKRVFWGFYFTMILAVVIRVAQYFIHETSLTTLAFFIPALAMLYTMHINPYNVSTGTLSSFAFEDMTKNLYARRKTFIVMSMLLPDYVGEGKSLPDVVKNQVRRFTSEYFRNGTLFQVGNGQIVMIARKDSNPDYNDWMQTILNAFTEQFNIHKIPFKIVYGDSFLDLINYNEYISLIDSIDNNIPVNTMHRIDVRDIDRFKQKQYIVSELEDIAKKGDLNDPRVLVYCQPVYNIKSQKFDTAEALMRLVLDDAGLVGPNLFIPIAESLGLIHALTRIILNKTCQTIRNLLDQNYDFKRISINVSITEIKKEGFCSEINRILYNNNVPGHKIALELTESQSEEDFLIMKDKIVLLREEGIKFYLDDFGTGYSNMERILELPFDIIKFDRSMVIAAGQDTRSLHIVKDLAKMFTDFDYSVLFEGVENVEDESRCLEMSAKYLQGFKYSKPIPIEKLSSFFEVTNK